MLHFNRKTSTITDTSNRILGFIKGGRFTQIDENGLDNSRRVCDNVYLSGLLPRELEQISELLQRNFV